MNWYVRYTTTDGQRLMIGPYDQDEVLDKRREIAAMPTVRDAYVSQY